MKRILIVCLFAVFAVSGSCMITEDNVDDLAMQLTNIILNRFDKSNFTGFDDFHVTFSFDLCNDVIFEASNFLKAVKEYRKTFPSGTVIKYYLLKAISQIPKYEGLQWNLHTEFLGQHYDLKFFYAWKITHWEFELGYVLNCGHDFHKGKIPDDVMTQFVLS